MSMNNLIGIAARQRRARALAARAREIEATTPPRLDDQGAVEAPSLRAERAWARAARSAAAAGLSPPCGGPYLPRIDDVEGPATGRARVLRPLGRGRESQ